MTESPPIPRHELISWNEIGQKWRDASNEHFCSANRDGDGWRVSARYGFPDGRRDIAFADEREAMRFFVNYVHSRRMGCVDGPRGRAAEPCGRPVLPAPVGHSLNPSR